MAVQTIFEGEVKGLDPKTLDSEATGNASSDTLDVRGFRGAIALELISDHAPDIAVALTVDDASITGGGSLAITDADGDSNTQEVVPTGTVSGGTFTLTYDGQTTGAIAFDANAATVQAALEALSNLAVGEVAVSGDPVSSGTLVITFTINMTCKYDIEGSLDGSTFYNVDYSLPATPSTLTQAQITTTTATTKRALLFPATSLYNYIRVTRSSNTGQMVTTKAYPVVTVR